MRGSADECNSFGIHRSEKTNIVVRRKLKLNDAQHVHIWGSRPVSLGTPDHYSVCILFHNMQIHVRIRLLMRGFGPVSFWIGHCAVAGEVVFLHKSQVPHKAIHIAGFVLFIDIIGHNGQGI